MENDKGFWRRSNMTRRACISLTFAAYSCSRNKSSAPAVRLATILGVPSPFVMQRLGLFAREGVTVQLEQVASTGKAVQALIGGRSEKADTGHGRRIQREAELSRRQAFFLVHGAIRARVYAA